jgi:hypothetical protein
MRRFCQQRDRPDLDPSATVISSPQRQPTSTKDHTMTTKLLPRLIATGALAAALSGVSAVTGLATSAHADPVVTRATGGGVAATLTIADVHAASRGQNVATTMCQTYIIPSADGLASNPTCGKAVYDAAVAYLGQGAQVRIVFHPDHTITTSAVR